MPLSQHDHMIQTFTPDGAHQPFRKRISPRSPWQNPFAERLVGSIRRECLDHVIVLGERHLRKILKSYCDYYLRPRTHLSLAKDAPVSRRVQPPEMGQVVEL